VEGSKETKENAMAKDGGRLRIYDPTIPFPRAAGGLAARGPIQGKRVGLLENSKRNSDIILQAVGARLAERAGVTVVGLWRKPTTLPVTPEIIDEMAAKCDLMVTGVGD
jgi:hypothetical protein